MNDDQQHVHDEETENKPREDEVKASRALPPAEDVGQPSEPRLDPRAHRHAGEDHHRQEYAQHEAVGDLLEEIVLAGTMIEIEPGMGLHISPDIGRAPFTARGCDVFLEMPVGQHARPHEKEGQGKGPGHKNVPVPRLCEAVEVGNGHPAREARNFEPCLLRSEPPVAPVQPPVRVRDVEAGHEKNDHADEVRPVPDARGKSVFFRCAAHTGFSVSACCRARKMTSRGWSSKCWPLSTNSVSPLARCPSARKRAASHISPSDVFR